MSEIFQRSYTPHSYYEFAGQLLFLFNPQRQQQYILSALELAAEESQLLGIDNHRRSSVSPTANSEFLQNRPAAETYQISVRLVLASSPRSLINWHW